MVMGASSKRSAWRERSNLCALEVALCEPPMMTTRGLVLRSPRLEHGLLGDVEWAKALAALLD